MHSLTESLSAKISKRLRLGISLGILISMAYEIPTISHATAMTRENSPLQTQDSSKKPLSPTAKASPSVPRKSHRLIHRPTPLTGNTAASLPKATLKQATQTSSTETIPVKMVPTVSGTTPTRDTAIEKVSPPIAIVAPMVSPLVAGQVASTPAAAASPSALMGSAQPSARVAAAAPSGARGPSLPGRMQRLLSELPGAAQIVAYQEEDPDPTVVIPTLTRNPSVLSFSAVQNGSSPAAQSLTITNTGPGTLTWTASSNSTWLTLNNTTSASGTNLGSVSVRVNPAGLSVGNHSGLITIVGTGAANSPQTVTVSFDVTAAPTPTIGLSATTLSFSAVQGGSNPANKTISLSNSGSGTLSWTATENAGWLSLTPASGTGPGTITVSVNTAGMTAGTVSTPITITASGATNTPQTVTVSLTITAAAVPTAIGVTPGSLTFTAQQGGGNPSNPTLSITNTGSGTLSWTVSDNAAWLSPSPASGTGNGTVTIGVTTGTLSVGTYNAVVTVSAAGVTPKTVPVTFTVTAPPAQPTISITPTSLGFSGTAGGSNPAAKTVTVTNSGTGTLAWTVADNANWLTATQSGNSIVASVNLAGLNAGTYDGAITVSASGATNTPRMIPVTLTLTAPPAQPTIGLSPASLSFTATASGSNPSSQNIMVTNTGTGTLTWSVSDNANWLTATQSGNMVVASVNTSGLAAGTYSGVITITATGATNAPQSVPVNLTVSSQSSNQTATLQWNANNEPDLAGYKIYRATASGAYGAPIAVIQGNITSYAMPGLQVGTTYYFVVTSYDSSDNESGWSSEVSKSIF